MRRVMVLGSGGSGKSTLARRLEKITGLPAIHMDALQWKPGWVPSEPDEWKAKQEEIVAGENWIIDGNYSSTIPIRLERADTVIMLDLPRRICMWRAVKRGVNGGVREDMAPGCEERVFSKDFVKFLCWVWNYPKTRLPRIMEMVDNHSDRVAIYRFRSQEEIERFLADVEASMSMRTDDQPTGESGPIAS